MAIVTSADLYNTNTFLNNIIANFNGTLINNYYVATHSYGTTVFTSPKGCKYNYGLYRTPFHIDNAGDNDLHQIYFYWELWKTPNVSLQDGLGSNTISSNYIGSNVNGLVDRYNLVKSYDSAYIRDFYANYYYGLTIRTYDGPSYGRRSVWFGYPWTDTIDRNYFDAGDKITLYNGQTIFSIITNGLNIHYATIRSYSPNYVFLDFCHNQCHGDSGSRGTSYEYGEYDPRM